MKILRISCMFGGFLSLVLSLSAQTFTTLLSFDNMGAANPYAGLIQATDGNFYGTTLSGACGRGCFDGGYVFNVTLSGTLTDLYAFDCGQYGCPSGASPYAGLVQATDGTLYGTTENGGSNSYGTVFKITVSGNLTTLHNFDGGDGANPYAGLVQATNGNFYGTTTGGGATSNGTVFKITPSGELTTLYNFCSQNHCTDGANPVAALIQATDGSFYGTTSYGGANYEGTVFRVTPGGKLKTLYSFCSRKRACADGVAPYAALIQTSNGDLYGTTSGAGANGDYGTVFKITPNGKLTTLHSFDGGDGANPTAGLLQATNGNLYGTTTGGGATSNGTVFQITPSGKLTTLYSFCSQNNCTDGQTPYAGLVQDTNGNLYGTTSAGGANSVGTVFSLSVGLGPFVETNPTSGKVGTAVKILGTDLTGATSVTFNGTAAVFKVVSASLIKTTVPTGATTGTVEVTIPSGTLNSNVVFRVTK
jgi:uncharacterized repeat protein (TIGR03803 family)